MDITDQLTKIDIRRIKLGRASREARQIRGRKTAPKRNETSGLAELADQSRIDFCIYPRFPD
jgi:hypothetical protein